ncbi:hypothetical protein OG562_22520 [Streptomyces sp. NBC_01275]|uniref:hypothetical protein n=1 Tax=Streptomyces sp. NBC_01275 TaxID=2903807 RepID=UPI002254F569|nr:hypothetical protein [Streptomyces sp. NBC_01275]MCX4763687.1 hypothetical protein [Streptomyces sp. NBC_01275]
MPHTVSSTTKPSRTGRPTSTAAGPTRHSVDTTARNTSLLHGMALLFVPSKNNEQS